MLDWYHACVAFIAYFLEPPLLGLLARINSFLGWHLTLLPYWAHTMVVGLSVSGSLARFFPPISGSRGVPRDEWMAVSMPTFLGLGFGLYDIGVPWLFLAAMSLCLLLIGAGFMLREARVSPNDAERSANLEAAWALVSVPAAALLFIATNAGLKLAGL